MEVVSQKVADAKTAIFGTQGGSKNEEPPSGVDGRGTIDSPYDQGNAPAQSAPTTSRSEGAPKDEEPPAGIDGRGTIDSPYDQGNKPEQSADTSKVVSSGGQGTSTATSAQHTTPIIVEETSSNSPGLAKLPSPNDPLASASTTHQGSGNPMAVPTPEQEKVIVESRGRDETSQRTTSTLSPNDARTTGTAAKGGNFDAAKPGLRYERSVSPGQLDDGTHVRCSGDRGEGYNPGNKLTDKLKDKFHFGHKK